MSNSNKNRNILIAGLCMVVLLIGAIYAAFQTVKNVEGRDGSISKLDVKITNIISKNIVGTASNAEDPIFTRTSAIFKTNLKSSGDSIEYDITVTNEGKLNAKLDNIIYKGTNNKNINFITRGLKKGDVILSGSTGILTVKVEYPRSAKTKLDNKTNNLTVTLDYSQATTNP